MMYRLYALIIVGTLIGMTLPEGVTRAESPHSVIGPMVVYECSLDGKNMTGTAVVVDQSFLEGSFGVMVGTWNGDGTNYTPYGSASTYRGEVIAGNLVFRKPYFELDILLKGNGQGYHSAMLFNGPKVQIPLICKETVKPKLPNS